MSKKRKSSGYNHYVETNLDSPLYDKFEHESMCKTKNAYETEWQAQFVINETFERNKTKLTKYLCPFCNKWHLSSNI